MRRYFLLIAVTLLAVVEAGAQTAAAGLGGRVVDENGPIEGVTVVAIHAQTNAQFYATTDAGGWWQLLDVLPGGPYTLRIHYFGYNPMTVRGVFAYAGQHTVVDADLEAGTAAVRVDEAATSLRRGPELGGGTVPVSPLGFDLVSQRISTPVVFDVRQEASLQGSSRLWMTPTGSSRLHGSAYGFYSLPESIVPSVPAGLSSPVLPGVTGGLTLSAPLGSEDYLLFAGAQYDTFGLSAAGRFDGRINASNRLSVTGGHLAGGRLQNAQSALVVQDQSWAGGDWTTSLADGKASNRAQVLWSGDPSRRQLLAEDDFTLATGRERLLAGFQFAYQQFPATDSAAARFDCYVQDVVRLGQRITLQGGVRFSFPFAFSPRLSLYYDLTGDGRYVLRMGTAVYGVHGEGTVWKNLAAIDFGLPMDFKLTLEGIYGQAWRKAFYISTRNILDSHYALTARLERPFADRAWALASYTRSDGSVTDRLLAGFFYKASFFGRFATTLAVLYDGYSFNDDLSPASFSWMNGFEARLSQDLGFEIAGRDHTFQLTAYARHSFAGTQYLAGLRYLL